MPDQLSLFETPQPLPDRYRLFLGVFPDARAIHLIGDHQISLSEKFGLSGKPRPRNILHVTLHHIGDYPEMPERVIASTNTACTSALTGKSAVEVTLDHVKSFRG